LPAVRHARHARPVSVPTIFLVALLAAALSFAAAAVVAPPKADAATTFVATCGSKVRTYPSNRAPVMLTIRAGTRISATARVDRGAWRTTCGGREIRGQIWYRIGAIDGRSVRSLYNVGALYAPVGVFSRATPGGVSPLPAPTGWTEGIDVSHWQGTIDWGRVAAAGKRYAFIKASEDIDFVDWKYQTNRAQAKAVGLLVGAYHFARPERIPGDAAAEADHFLDTARMTSGELLPVLDLEVTGGLSPSELQRWAAEFLDRVYQRTGVRGIIYTSPSFWRNALGNTSWFSSNGYRVLWVAHWTTASAPSLPAGGWGGNGWTFWQYTSSGSVPGISGRVDLNRYNGTDLGPVLIP